MFRLQRVVRCSCALLFSSSESTSAHNIQKINFKAEWIMVKKKQDGE